MVISTGILRLGRLSLLFQLETFLVLFSTKKNPYVVTLNPNDDKQNILLAGISDKKVVQWEMNTR